MAPRQTLLERSDRVHGALGVVAPPPIHIETPTFQGSLATLFLFVKDHRVDLMDVPLTPVCEAYFTYLLANADANLDEAAAALAALAYLLERKAFMLLPVPEEDIELEEPFVLPDPSVQEFGLAMEVLRAWQEEREGIFFRSSEAGPNPYELPYRLKDVKASDLSLAFARLLHRAEDELDRPTGKARRSLTEMMKEVLIAVCHEWRTVEELVRERLTRTEAVYWFLALLELVRLGQVVVQLHQDEVRFARA
ncbi:MAG TPA: segregation/condensation protein A [Fimbriimonas sp.]